MNQNTTTAWPEWWGAAGQVAANDDGPGINAAIVACYTGSVTCAGNVSLSMANKNYYLKTTINVIYSVGILAQPGALIQPSSSGGATVGMILGTAGSGSLNFEAPITLPAISGFSSIGLQLRGCCLANITTGLIQACGDGIQLYADNVYGSCLDNDISVSGGIYTCTASAIKIKTAGNSSTPGVIQGNTVYANFIEGCQRWLYFVNTATGGGQGAQNVNTFVAEAIDWNDVVSFVAIDNATGYGNTANIYQVNGFFASGHTTMGMPDPIAIGSYASGQFGVNCVFIGFPSPFANWTQFGVVEGVGDFGNRYDAFGIESRNMADISAQNAPNSRTGYNGGNPPSDIFNRTDVTMTLPGDLTAGSTQNFYIYHMLALGNARLGFTARGMQGCIINQITDNSATNANEILIQVMNVSGSTVNSGTVLTGQVVIGIP